MYKFLSALITIIFISCLHKNEYKIIDYGEFQIEVPYEWKKLNLKGKDSKIGGLVTNSQDTLVFDLGMYSNELDVYAEIKDSIIENVISNENDPEKRAQMILNSIKYRDFDSINLESLSKYIIEYKNINNKKAKIIYPKKEKIGITGIYIKNVNPNDSAISFNFYGEIKSKENEDKFLKSLQTLKFNFK